MFFWINWTKRSTNPEGQDVNYIGLHGIQHGEKIGVFA